MKRRILVASENSQDLEVVFVSEDYAVEYIPEGKKALELLLKTNTYDLIIVNSKMVKSKNLHLLKELRTYEKTRVIPLLVLSYNNSVDDHIYCLKNGADDYIIMPIDKDLFLTKVETLIRRNEVLCSEYTTKSLLKSDKEVKEASINTDFKNKLTKRQLEILTLMSKGHSNKTIAQMLYLSETTIKAHLRSIFKKLKVKNRTQAVLVAINQDISES